MKGTAALAGVKQECCTVSCFLSVEKSVAMLGVDGSKPVWAFAACHGPFQQQRKSQISDLRPQAPGGSGRP